MNRHVIIGRLGDTPEIFLFDNMDDGSQVAKELKKSPVWAPIYCGSLSELITMLEGADTP